MSHLPPPYTAKELTCYPQDRPPESAAQPSTHPRPPIATKMNQWPQGSQSHLNPSSMYSNLGNGTQFDFNQYSQGLQQNGTSGTHTPGFSNQTFQPGPVVPAKRPHDGMAGSPVQAQGSRSHTPSYGGFPSQQGGQQFPNAPTPYSHLQQQPGSSNATPSPTMQNQQFRPPTQPQRMQNASPSPFPSQQQGNFGNQMSPGPQQNASQPTSMAQQNQRGGFSQQYGMNNNMSMSGMPTSMPGQMNNMGNMGQENARQLYQQRLMQQQAQLRNSGMIPPRNVGAQPTQAFNSAGQQGGAGQMQNGQAGAQMNATQQQHQYKRTQFLKTLQGHAAQQGRHFNPTPTIGGRPVDLYMLWSLLTQLGGSQNVERAGQWQNIANKMGFSQPQFPSAPEELKQLHHTTMSQYERLWFAMRAQQKQETARMHAHQMAGLGGLPQGSPGKTMQAPAQQQNQYAQFQQSQQGQPQAQATPVQQSAQLPQNGMTTPQQQMMRHRRDSSLRKADQMTPQAAVTAPSPQSAGKASQRSPSIKQEASVAVLRNEEPQSTNYVPAARTIEWDGGYDIPALFDLGTAIARSRPDMPTASEMGIIDMKAITLSLASGIHAEVRYALDAMCTITNDPGVNLELEKCDDLIDVLIDCAEEQVEQLSEEAAEVSDALDLTPYEDIMRACRTEAETLQEVHELGTHAFDMDRAADKVIAITTILRNLTFYEHNHRLLTSTPVIRWLSNTIRLLGTRNQLLRTSYNTQDFYKDIITFLSNVTQSLELPSRDDALHILHFLLAFAPQPSPSYDESGGKLSFPSFNPNSHRYLPPAVDCLAKLLARQDPNRMLYRSIFTSSSSSSAESESPLDLLTRAFALSVSVLPNRANRTYGNNALLRIVEARKAYLTQGMLAADILTSLAPNNETDLARSWIESEDGWAVGLLSLAALLSVDKQPAPSKGRELGLDTETFKLITHRALTMMKRLAEKAGKLKAVTDNRTAVAEDEDLRASKWEGIPQGHAILGACLLAQTDRTALKLLCGLHDLSMLV
ncbi:hypothetical protein LTR37_004922 [Vermiconidia calcicola]|uniref:Uncharacterized protein n=1 Tax=Vermiconidia calcicola TaxID=1690605 RepID=A0ACC3NLR6_9PEZI|nr:hypothetical protein LTR37_004922 [Vermiconidia calcicola]